MYILYPPEISPSYRDVVGGKAYALARMVNKGLLVPPFLSLTIHAYREYVFSTGLASRILLELNRKSFADMRWEEIWDAALRIRNLFINTPIPDELARALKDNLHERFASRPVVVRSSAPGEDASAVSFAGLHESFVNVVGAESIIDHVRLVWASLWSDRALLYRRELGLDINNSFMAVVVQEMALGERSGVMFTVNPVNSDQAVVEAVHGLNQGLVDGTVEPDRWILDRKTGKVISHQAAHREEMMAPSPTGVGRISLPKEMKHRPPLNAQEIRKVFVMGKLCESIFGSPQDVEFTFHHTTLYTLQSRPITTAPSADKNDLRPWYLSLTRSFENLKSLRIKIEGDILPAMDNEALGLASVDLTALTDGELAAEIEARTAILDKWLKAYDDYCIPFAHGMRLFGQAYNDVVRPSDPYEFMDILKADEMASLERNRMLAEMASLVRKDSALREALMRGRTPRSAPFFTERLKTFERKFGETVSRALGKNNRRGRKVTILPLILQMAERPVPTKAPKGISFDRGEKDFLSHFTGEKLLFARELLDLARASYRLRDDDNIYLGRIEAQVMRTVEEGKRRLRVRGLTGAERLVTEEVVKALRDRGYVPPLPLRSRRRLKKRLSRIKARQLIGQPAGPGIASGLARVILDAVDLLHFKSGEVLVCDAIDPNMTFVVPLAAAIVERRGGMLIHGAIIAREYGLPCVTGIPDVTALITTGQRITVDGYLGIVIIG